MRIILIEDQKTLSSIIQKGLKEEGYSVDSAYDGEEGLYLAENFPADVIILDIMIPKMDGIKILESIRKKGIKTPVLLLTAKDTTSDKIKGLDSGADDYLTKPFEFGELLARIRSLIRRGKDIKSPVIVIDDLEINTASHEVKRGGKTITLSSKEYSVLEYLAYNKERVVARGEIIEHVYNESFDMNSNLIDVYINYIRNKIDKGFKKKLIQTIRGSGYILKDN